MKLIVIGGGDGVCMKKTYTTILKFYTCGYSKGAISLLDFSEALFHETSIISDCWLVINIIQI